VLAPVLAVLGLAGAYPVVAARVRTAAGRAALGALGALWLVLAEALTHDTLLLGPARGVPRAAEAQEAISIAGDALARTVGSGVLLLAVLWAAAAVVLPWIVRGWSLAMDAVAAAAWAAGLAAGTGALAGWLGDRVVAAEPRGLAVGAVAGALAAVAGAHAPQARYWPHDDVE
jgi:eukaryotic-like serine/threonine-protein kinase